VSTQAPDATSNNAPRERATDPPEQAREHRCRKRVAPKPAQATPQRLGPCQSLQRLGELQRRRERMLTIPRRCRKFLTLQLGTQNEQLTAQ